MTEAEREAVEQAMDSAVRSFQVTRKMSSFQRSDVLRKIADGIRSQREQFTRTICMEAAKPIKTARIEVDRGMYTFQVAAEEATRIYGEYIPLDTLESFSRALGPVAALSSRSRLRYYTIQLSHEPGGTQDCARDCRRVPSHPETRSTNTHYLPDARRSDTGIGLAGGSPGGDAAFER